MNLIIFIIYICRDREREWCLLPLAVGNPKICQPPSLHVTTTTTSSEVVQPQLMTTMPQDYASKLCPNPIHVKPILMGPIVYLYGEPKVICDEEEVIQMIYKKL